MPEPDSSEIPPSKRSRLDRRPLAAVNEVLDGKYRLLRPLQRGSMGAVFAAENLSLGAPVAVKVIRADVSPDDRAEIAKRMVQEAHAAFLVDHPAILRVLDVGTTPQGNPYVVMELLRGKTLGASIAEHGSAEPAQAIRVLMPIAHGLVAAHACGVIHRDLKPTNVFLARTRDGRTQPKIIDFGLARALAPTSSRITQMGNTMGSPTYMSPEQIRGEDVTEQADIWGFTVMLYETIGGEPPFVAGTLEGLFGRVLTVAPTPLPKLGKGDDALWAIVAKGLHKDPAKRWGTMRELGSALAGWLVARGYRDDVCGASLESVWLQPPRSTAKVEVLAAEPVPEPVAPRRARRRSFSDMSTGQWKPIRLRRGPWLYLALSLLALTGIAAAITGYLGVSLPGLPHGWRSLWPWQSSVARDKPPVAAPTAVNSPAIDLDAAHAPTAVDSPAIDLDAAHAPTAVDSPAIDLDTDRAAASAPVR